MIVNKLYTQQKRRGIKRIIRHFLGLPWEMILLVCVLAGIGCVTLYSAAGGKWDPWAMKQMMRFGIGFCMMIGVSLLPLREIYHWTYSLFGLSLFLLFVVELMGFVGMGARRWVNLGFFQLQPSELVKITIILAIARYFHRLTAAEARTAWAPIMPLLFLMVPAALIVRQPDLGTTLMIIMVGLAMIVVAGIHKVYLVVGGIGCLAAGPLAWPFLHTYQKKRVLTFLTPENDPLGAGYHIIQSKIALGSGGLFGKGYMKGSQSYLNFLPEKQTDFIFTMIGEEWGFVGAVSLLLLYCVFFVYGYKVCWRAQSQFARLTAFGVTTSLFLYVFVNTAMVMGVLPVVGIPLPLISYGGTALLTLMTAFGLLFSCDAQSHTRIPTMRSQLS